METTAINRVITLVGGPANGQKILLHDYRTEWRVWGNPEPIFDLSALDQAMPPAHEKYYTYKQSLAKPDTFIYSE